MTLSDINVGQNCSLDISDLSQVSLQLPDVKCTSDTTNSDKLQAELTAKLGQNAIADVKAALPTAIFNNATTTNLHKTVNDVVNNVNFNSISACVQNTMQDQTMLLQNLKGSCPAFCTNPNPSDTQLKAIEGGA
ncbi:UNVERIFIED_CONTAM: hypothetical protein HDU68_006797, partial [Siphonaria sp. JEL0065]